VIDSSQLYLGHYSLPAPPAERFAAAAEAGFTGMSLFWPEVLAAREAEGGLDGVKRRLGRLGAPQMEIILLPGADGLPGFPALARDIAETSAELGCEVVHAAALDMSASFETVAKGFGVLAEACARAGLSCGVEFVPFITAAPDLDTAVRMVRAVDVPTAGIVVDALHFFRIGAPWAELEALRPGDVVSIQVNDGPAARPNDDYHAEAMGLRQLPGEGEFDLARFVAVLEAVGATAPLTCEVMSHDLNRLPAGEAAGRLAATTRALLKTHLSVQPGAGRDPTRSVHG
jgi:sugar phosphate isomerase/epimerase